MSEIKTVLCPVDFSPASEVELNLATQLCERFGARMILQHNIDDVPPVYLANAWMYSETHMYPEEEQGSPGISYAPSHARQTFQNDKVRRKDYVWEVGRFDPATGRPASGRSHRDGNSWRQQRQARFTH